MELREIYNEISALLNRVEYSKIEAGFKRYPFALYNEEIVCFADGELPYDERFVGNTAIKLDGSLIAIWNVLGTDADDIEILTADIVHEIFHCYQMEQEETRYPDDFALLLNPEDIENHCARLVENRLLLLALGGKSSAYEGFCASRIHRAAHMGSSYIHEHNAELIEGMASYAGLRALYSLSAEKAEERLAQYKDIVVAVGITFFDVRQMAYFTGTLARFAADLFGGDSCFEAKKLEIEDDIRSAIVSGINEYKHEIDVKFDEFNSKPRSETIGDYRICGYDPMNMYIRNNELLCTHFLMLADSNNENGNFIKGSLIARINLENPFEVYSYST